MRTKTGREVGGSWANSTPYFEGFRRGLNGTNHDHERRQTNRPTVHDALEVALLLLRLRDGGGGVLLAAVDELALVPPPDDRSADSVDGVGAPDDADALLLGRGEHAADAAAVPSAIVDGDAGRKVGRLPRNHRRKSRGKTAGIVGSSRNFSEEWQALATFNIHLIP